MTSETSDSELLILSNNQYGIVEKYMGSAISPMFKSLLCLGQECY